MRSVMPAANGFRAVLFDWDGTLVDSAERTYRCYVRVFSAYGIGYDHDDFERTYSPDWYRTYEHVGLQPEHWPEADARWLSCYETEASELVPGRTRCWSGSPPRGSSRGWCRAATEAACAARSQALGLERFFGAVVCGGETARRKPDPEPLLAALERLGLLPAETAYVGDSPEDVAMAKAAGAFAVGIPGGFPNREALAASRPDLLAPSLEEALPGAPPLGA